MVHSELAALKCKPCEGGIPPMNLKEAERLLEKVAGWRLEGEKIQRVFKFGDFRESIKFMNQSIVCFKLKFACIQLHLFQSNSY